MNVIKASAYWYDDRHDGSDGSGNTGAVADVDLAVVDTDAIKVHFSFFGEDSDRESPVFNTSTGAGVYPEHL